MLLVLALAFVLAGKAIGQDVTAHQAPKNSKGIKYVYVHGMLGLALDTYTSKDITHIVGQGRIIRTLGTPIQYGIRGGFRNIVQLEFSMSSTSAHDIGSVGFSNGQVVPAGQVIPITSIPMKLKESKYLFKINPAFWSWGKQNNKDDRCLFLVLGSGNVKYEANAANRFSGTGMVLGIEMASMRKYVSGSIGVTYQMITFDPTTFEGMNIPSKSKANRFMLYMRIGLGYGF